MIKKPHASDISDIIDYQEFGAKYIITAILQMILEKIYDLATTELNHSIINFI